MNTTAILALISAILTNAPTIGADMQKLIGVIAGLVQTNPAATAAEIQSKIAAALADAAATDKVVETASV